MSQHESFQNSNAVADLNAVAMRALAALIADPISDAQREVRLLDAKLQRRLSKAAIDPEWVRFDRVIADLIAADASYEDIANLHVPAVARQLGQDWADGKMAFADVSIGCARLQSYLRQKGLEWCDTASIAATSIATVLLVVPDYEQHTLGATLLAGQLRAQGVDVVLAYHAPMADLKKMVTNQVYDAVLISSSRGATLASLHETVVSLSGDSTNTPVILGGSVLDQVPDVLSRTGADFKATSWQDVLGLLAIRSSKNCAYQIGSNV